MEDRVVVTVPCGGCGATLPMPAQGERVDCAFCGHNTELSDVALDKRRQLSQTRRRLRGEGLDSIEGAQLQAFRPGVAGAMMVLSVVCVGSIAAVVGMTALGKLLGGGGKPDPIVSLILLLLAFGFWLVLVLSAVGTVIYQAQTAPRRAEEVASALRSAARGKVGRSSCPQCGVPTQLAPELDQLICASCEAKLLVADGVLVARVTEAQAQKALWRAQAHRVWTAAAKKHSRKLRAWTAVATGLPLLMLIFVVVCSGFVGLVLG